MIKQAFENVGISTVLAELIIATVLTTAVLWGPFIAELVRS